MPLFIFTFRSELYLLCDMYMYVYVSSASASISPMRYMYLNKGFLVHYFFFLFYSLIRKAKQSTSCESRDDLIHVNPTNK